MKLPKGKQQRASKTGKIIWNRVEQETFACPMKISEAFKKPWLYWTRQGLKIGSLPAAWLCWGVVFSPPEGCLIF